MTERFVPRAVLTTFLFLAAALSTALAATTASADTNFDAEDRAKAPVYRRHNIPSEAPELYGDNIHIDCVKRSEYTVKKPNNEKFCDNSYLKSHKKAGNSNHSPDMQTDKPSKTTKTKQRDDGHQQAGSTNTDTSSN